MNFYYFNYIFKSTYSNLILGQLDTHRNYSKIFKESNHKSFARDTRTLPERITFDINVEFGEE